MELGLIKALVTVGVKGSDTVVRVPYCCCSFDVQKIDVIHRAGGLYWDLEVLSAALGGPQNREHSYFPIQSDLRMSTILTFFHSRSHSDCMIYGISPACALRKKIYQLRTKGRLVKTTTCC